MTLVAVIGFTRDGDVLDMNDVFVDQFGIYGAIAAPWFAEQFLSCR